MKNGLEGLNFCSVYKQAIRLKEKVDSIPDSMKDSYRMFGSYPPFFEVHTRENNMSIGVFGVQSTCRIMALDSEDLEYLYNKYSKNKEDIIIDEIEKVKEKYKDI